MGVRHCLLLPGPVDRDLADGNRAVTPSDAARDLAGSMTLNVKIKPYGDMNCAPLHSHVESSLLEQVHAGVDGPSVEAHSTSGLQLVERSSDAESRAIRSG